MLISNYWMLIRHGFFLSVHTIRVNMPIFQMARARQASVCEHTHKKRGQKSRPCVFGQVIVSSIPLALTLSNMKFEEFCICAFLCIQPCMPRDMRHMKKRSYLVRTRIGIAWSQKRCITASNIAARVKAGKRAQNY